MTVAGALAIATPMVVGEQAAGAATTTSTANGSLTFINKSGSVETCNINLEATRDTSPVLAQASTGESGATLDCVNANVDLDIVLTYDDQYGHAQTVESDDLSTGDLTAYGAVSKVKATVTAYYFHCDPNQNATCSLTITTAPK